VRRPTTKRVEMFKESAFATNPYLESLVVAVGSRRRGALVGDEPPLFPAVVILRVPYVIRPRRRRLQP
jgi:hypothetical protein